MLDDLAALDAPDVDLVCFERPARRRHGAHDAAGSDPLLELAQVRAAHEHPGHYLVFVNNLLLDFVVQVGERGPPHRDDVPHPGMTVFPLNAEVGELVIHEVVDSRKFPAIPDQIQEAANDRAVVLLDSHKTFPRSVPSACLPIRLPAGPERRTMPRPPMPCTPGPMGVSEMQGIQASGSAALPKDHGPSSTQATPARTSGRASRPTASPGPAPWACRS